MYKKRKSSKKEKNEAKHLSLVSKSENSWNNNNFLLPKIEAKVPCFYFLKKCASQKLLQPWTSVFFFSFLAIIIFYYIFYC